MCFADEDNHCELLDDSMTLTQLLVTNHNTASLLEVCFMVSAWSCSYHHINPNHNLCCLLDDDTTKCRINTEGLKKPIPCRKTSCITNWQSATLTASWSCASCWWSNNSGCLGLTPQHKLGVGVGIALYLTIKVSCMPICKSHSGSSSTRSLIPINCLILPSTT